jgi:transposase
MTIEEISNMFKIDRKTIYWWRKRRGETGSIKPSSGFQKGSQKIKDLESFVNFLAENMDITVEKVIEKYSNMCKVTVYNCLNKLNYT